MISKLLLPITLLLVLLTGCFGPDSTPEPTTTFTAADIETPGDSSTDAIDSVLPSEKSTDQLRPAPLTADMQEILTTHARIREILNDLIQSQQELNTELQQEFSTLLDRSGPFATSTELQHFKESLIGVLTTYKLYFYEDSLASLQLGSYVKSELRSHYEAYLQDLGAIDKKKLEENDELIHRIAAKLPIPYKEEQGIVIDQAILEVLIANQKKINLRVDHIFDSYTLAAIETPETHEAPETVETIETIETVEAAEATVEAPETVETVETVEAPEADIPNVVTVFTLGSSAEEVKALMGEPDWIQNYKFVGDEWQYGNSYVRFDADFNVNGFNNQGNNLKVQINTIIPGAEPIIIGSTKQQVAEFIGTPDAVFNYNSAGSSWSYGKSRVDFDKEGIVKGWVNSADFNLFDQ